MLQPPTAPSAWNSGRTGSTVRLQLSSDGPDVEEGWPAPLTHLLGACLGPAARHEGAGLTLTLESLQAGTYNRQRLAFPGLVPPPAVRRHVAHLRLAFMHLMPADLVAWRLHDAPSSSSPQDGSQAWWPALRRLTLEHCDAPDASERLDPALLDWSALRHPIPTLESLALHGTGVADDVLDALLALGGRARALSVRWLETPTLLRALRRLRGVADVRVSGFLSGGRVLRALAAFPAVRRVAVGGVALGELQDDVLGGEEEEQPEGRQEEGGVLGHMAAGETPLTMAAATSVAGRWVGPAAVVGNCLGLRVELQLWQLVRVPARCACIDLRAGGGTG